MKRSVLVVEDDPSIATGLALNLRIGGYEPEVVGDGDEALERIRRQPPMLVLLDISLPGKNGLEVLAALRDDRQRVPVIVLSARQEEFDKVAALKLGADDYVTKPFALAELMARVDAVLRRAGQSDDAAPAPSARLVFANVVVDLDSRTVQRSGERVPLTHLELQLLVYLLRHPGQVLTRAELLREVWGVRHAGSRRTVDNFIAQLRAKLERDADRPRHFVTVRGSGYRFDP